MTSCRRAFASGVVVVVLASVLRLGGAGVVLAQAQSPTSPTPGLQVASTDAESFGRFGSNVVRVGDANGDGWPDLLVGAPSENGDRVGTAYLYSGRDGRPIGEVTYPEGQSRAEFGASIARLDDVDEDGRADVAVGAPKETTGRRDPQAGRVYYLSGRDGEELEDIESPNERPNSRFGFAMSAISDVDGDGKDDLIVSAPSEVVAEEPLTRGRVYVVSGDDGDDLTTFEPPPSGVRLFGFDVAGLDDINGNGVPDVLVGIVGASPQGKHWAGSVSVYDAKTQSQLLSLTSPNPSAEGNFGASVAHAGDVDNDGISDFVVGAPVEPSEGKGKAGRAYVFSGRNGQMLHELVSASPQTSGRFGEDVARIGDVDGDGTTDLAVGAPGEASSAGRVHVFSGSDGTRLRTIASPQDIINGRFGISIAPAGDLDGDGQVDLFVGAQGETSPQGTEQSGRAYVYYASSLAPPPVSDR